ncbi:hypothetical protein PAMP_020187 [Pampus punctatissimus]
MDRRANSDVMFLPDEKFDFDVSLSPASSRGDEDEDDVFVDQVSHKKRCISDNMVPRLEGGCGGVRVSWSPLTGEQLEAMCEEAIRLANHLQSSEPSRPHSDEIASVTSDATTDREEFVQDTEAKLGVIGQPANALSPIKRQTFCVQDSPMKQLPPAIQSRLQRAAASSTRPATIAAASTRPATTAAASTRPATSAAATPRPATSAAATPRLATSAAATPRLATTAAATPRPATSVASSTRLASTARLGTFSPVGEAKSKPRTALRGKAVLGVSVTLPSKPAAPSTSCSANKSRVEKTRLQPPSKAATVVWRRSPDSRPSSRAESYEDLLSDSTSVASDISVDSLNSSLGKHTLAPPTKTMRTLSGGKAAPLQRKKVTERKNTSSSSSSVSSFNSSLSLSPATGKLNSSLNRSPSVSSVPAPSSVSKPASQNRQRRSNVYAAAEPASSTAGRRSLSSQARKLSTPLKRAEATPLQATPAKRVLERTASIPATASTRLQSGQKAKPKPQGLAPPKPSGGVRGVRHGDGVSSPDASKMLKLMSTSSVDSLPQKASAGPLTPSAGGCRSLQVKVRRPSALPTPLRSRSSAIPATMPTNKTCPTRPPPTSDSALVRRTSSCNTAPTESQEAEPVDDLDIQPFCLDEEELPAAPPSSAPQPDHSESTDTGALSQVQSETSRTHIDLETTEETNSKTQEVLLFDLPAPTLQPQEKLLIDLTSTPDLIRTSNKTCITSQQLIDLSSPLIKWSPEDKKENDAPLINLSF